MKKLKLFVLSTVVLSSTLCVGMEEELSHVEEAQKEAEQQGVSLLYYLISNASYGFKPNETKETVREQSIIQALLNTEDLNEKEIDPHHGETTLLVTAITRYLNDVVLKLVQKGVDVDTLIDKSDFGSYTALHVAAEYGGLNDESLFRKLVGASKKRQIKGGPFDRTPLEQAKISKNKLMIHVLNEFGVTE